MDPRIQFASERTLLAWVRTGLSMMGFGFVVAKFGLFMRELLVARGINVPGTGISHWMGTALVALGVLVNIAAALQHWRRMQEVEKGEQPAPMPLPLATLLPAILALLGALLALYLVRYS